MRKLLPRLIIRTSIDFNCFTIGYMTWTARPQSCRLQGMRHALALAMPGRQRLPSILPRRPILRCSCSDRTSGYHLASRQFVICLAKRQTSLVVMAEMARHGIYAYQL